MTLIGQSQKDLMMSKFTDQLLGACLATAVLGTGMALVLYNECVKEIQAFKAAHWLYKVLSQ